MPGSAAQNRQRHQAPVAQLDRAPDYESGGQEFESLRARHFSCDTSEGWVSSISIVGTTSVAAFQDRALKRRRRNAATATRTISRLVRLRRKRCRCRFAARQRQCGQGSLQVAHRVQASARLACRVNADRLFQNDRFASPRPKAWLHDGGTPRTNIPGQ
jgi:hypothetical protein